MLVAVAVVAVVIGVMAIMMIMNPADPAQPVQPRGNNSGTGTQTQPSNFDPDFVQLDSTSEDADQTSDPAVQEGQEEVPEWSTAPNDEQNSEFPSGNETLPQVE